MRGQLCDSGAMTEARGQRALRWVLLASLWLSLMVLVMKVWIGWGTQSLSLLAVSLHTLVNVFSLFLGVVGVATRYSRGREIWGHSRLEAAMTLLMVAFMGFACFSLLAIALYQFVLSRSHPSPVTVTAPLLQFLGGIVVITFCLASFERYQAGLLDSSTLRLAASRALQDVWLTLGVLGGLVATSQGVGWVDSLAAIALVSLVLWGGWQVLCRQLPLLVQQVAIAPEAIAQTISQIEGITHCSHIRSWGLVGRQVVIEAQLVFHPDYVGLAQMLAERVEQILQERYGNVKVVLYIARRAPSDGSVPSSGKHPKTHKK